MRGRVDAHSAEQLRGVGRRYRAGQPVGQAEYRRSVCAAQSGKCIAAYLYSAAGQGESTTGLAWDGHALIYENGELLAEAERFADGEQMITADIDLDRLVQDRMRLTS